MISPFIQYYVFFSAFSFFHRNTTAQVVSIGDTIIRNPTSQRIPKERPNPPTKLQANAETRRLKTTARIPMTNPQFLFLLSIEYLPSKKQSRRREPPGLAKRLSVLQLWSRFIRFFSAFCADCSAGIHPAFRCVPRYQAYTWSRFAKRIGRPPRTQNRPLTLPVSVSTSMRR